jgi:hypothetical protein
MQAYTSLCAGARTASNALKHCCVDASSTKLIHARIAVHKDMVRVHVMALLLLLVLTVSLLSSLLLPCYSNHIITATSECYCYELPPLTADILNPLQLAVTPCIQWHISAQAPVAGRLGREADALRAELAEKKARLVSLRADLGAMRTAKAEAIAEARRMETLSLHADSKVYREFIMKHICKLRASLLCCNGI